MKTFNQFIAESYSDPEEAQVAHKAVMVHRLKKHMKANDLHVISPVTYNKRTKEAVAGGVYHLPSYKKAEEEAKKLHPSTFPAGSPDVNVQKARHKQDMERMKTHMSLEHKYTSEHINKMKHPAGISAQLLVNKNVEPRFGRPVGELPTRWQMRAK